MNSYKQSKSSIIFQTCWTKRGATLDEIDNALYEAGFEMPIGRHLTPMLKTLQRKGQLKQVEDKWVVVPKPYSHNRN